MARLTSRAMLDVTTVTSTAARAIGPSHFEIDSIFPVMSLLAIHSPPGFSTGRTLCQNNSLLRI